MRVTTTKSKFSESFYINYAYIDKNGKSTSKIFKKLGTLNELKEKLGTDDRDEVMKWAKEQARIATEQHKAESETVLVPLSPKSLINLNERRSFNCGYLFLQKICSDLRIDNICRNIKGRHKFKYDIQAIPTASLCWKCLNILLIMFMMLCRFLLMNPTIYNVTFTEIQIFFMQEINLFCITTVLISFLKLSRKMN